jgi:TolB protein
MKRNFKFQISNFKFVTFLFLPFTVYCLLLTAVDAKVYIDITSPAFRKLPISIAYTGHEKAGEISGIVKEDLDFTGIFYFIDPDVPGAEIRISIEAEVPEKIKAETVVFDLIENRKILNKKYSASEKILRVLAHSIANDIFGAITGRDGAFRTKLSYVGSTSDKKHLYITDWDGYNTVRVVAKGMSLSNSWSPDGLSIIYSSERGRKWGIYSLDLKDYGEKALFTSKGLNLVGNVGADRHIAFSSSKSGNSEIYTMNFYGSSVKRLTRSFGIDLSPAFSPDGSQIAFVSDRGGSPQIYTMDVSGRRVKRLTFKGSYNTSPAWSADGKWIGYAGRIHGKNQIFMIKFDKADLRQLTYEGNNEGPTFSPDGMFVAFDSDREGKKGIYIMSINSEEIKRITPKNMKAMNPNWSPYFQ